MAIKFKRKRRLEVNDGFLDFVFNWDHYEYFLLGGYGSSKSYNTALKLIHKAKKEKRVFLIIRNVSGTHRDSTFEDLREAIDTWGWERHFHCTTHPLSIRCLSSGSRFIFRGLDDWRKLKSIKNVSCVWIEEGEGSMEAYKELKDRMRASGVEPHIIITTNPQPKRHWVYQRFIEELGIKEEDFYNEGVIVKDEVYLHHSTYKNNLRFLNPRWVKNLEAETDPVLIRIKREGRFGSDGTRVLHNIKQMDSGEMYGILNDFMSSKYFKHFVGMDWGFETSFNACIRMAVDDRDPNNKDLYIYREYYSRQKLNSEIMEDLEDLRKSGDLITADCAEPKTIREFATAGFNIRGCTKFPGSVKYNIRKLKQFRNIYISDACPNTWGELDELMFKKDKMGDIIEDEFNIDSHTKDGIVYGLDQYHHEDLKDYDGWASSYYSRGGV